MSFESYSDSYSDECLSTGSGKLSEFGPILKLDKVRRYEYKDFKRREILKIEAFLGDFNKVPIQEHYLFNERRNMVLNDSSIFHFGFIAFVSPMLIYKEKDSLDIPVCTLCNEIIRLSSKSIVDRLMEHVECYHKSVWEDFVGNCRKYALSYDYFTYYRVLYNVKEFPYVKRTIYTSSHKKICVEFYRDRLFGFDDIPTGIPSIKEC
uniref:C2H2-type domain-containing protein n=1 Tax=Parastrongyloides trichosuri TaxID=131310 RepID=A0A0N4ZGR5_PARTI